MWRDGNLLQALSCTASTTHRHCSQDELAAWLASREVPGFIIKAFHIVTFTHFVHLCYTENAIDPVSAV